MASPIAPAAAAEPSPPPPAAPAAEETARGDRIWRVAAAVASGFFHATDKGGAEAPSKASSSSSSSASSAAAAAASAAFFAADAADYPDFVDELVDLICRFTPHDDRPDLLRLLRLLDTKFGTLLVAGRGGGKGAGGSVSSPPRSEEEKKKKKKKHDEHLPFLPRRFADFSPREREAVLLRWMRTTGPLGQAARGLKSLVFLALFRFVEGGEEGGGGGGGAASSLSASASASAGRKNKNPFWAACSYSSPASLLLRGGSSGSGSSRGGSSGGIPCSNGNGSRRPPSLSAPLPSPSPSSAAAAPAAALLRAPPSPAAASVVVSPAKVASEATLLARTVDASKLFSKVEASARFSALGFAPSSSSTPAAAAAAGKKTTGRESKGEDIVLTLQADAVVVGSGAGGGVAAALLAASGLRVVVVEKGRYCSVAAPSSASSASSSSIGNDCEHLDLSERALSHTYERGTLCSSRDLSATALAGSTLGGGTRINWCASFPTPDHVRDEWSAVGGLPVAPAAKGSGEEEGAPSRFDRALAAVCSRMRVGFIGSNGGGGLRTSGSFSSPPSCSLPPASTQHNGPNFRLAEGLSALGQHAGRVPRNCSVSASGPASSSACSSTADCGRCCFGGCPSGDKQDHTHTFLADAARSGALIVTGAIADRVLLEEHRKKTEKKTEKKKEKNKEEGKRGACHHHRGRVAVGVEATPLPAGSPLPFEKKQNPSSSSSTGPPFRLVVRAPIVVASAGSLHTPALLLRSGLRNRNIGRGLRLHPSLVVLGRFPARKEEEEGNGVGDIENLGSVRMDRGPIMSSFGKGSADWEGSGYGPLLMTPSLHLAGFAATVPWRGSAEHKRLLAAYGDTSPVLVLTRDGSGGGKRGGSKGGGGRVSLDSQGQPRFDFRPSIADAKAMAKGAGAAVEALAAAGAIEIGSFLHTEFLSLPPSSDGAAASSSSTTADREERKLAVERYKKHIATIFGPRAIRRRGGAGATVLSAHQMGTARAGTSPKTGVVEGATGESWEVSNLFIADASLFPTASGVNPMISVCALSWMVSEGICEKVVGKERAAAAVRSVLSRGGAGGGAGASSSLLSPAAILKEAVEGGSGLGTLPLSSSAGSSSSSRGPVLVSREEKK